MITDIPISFWCSHSCLHYWGLCGDCFLASQVGTPCSSAGVSEERSNLRYRLTSSSQACPGHQAKSKHFLRSVSFNPTDNLYRVITNITNTDSILQRRTLRLQEVKLPARQKGSGCCMRLTPMFSRPQCLELLRKQKACFNHNHHHLYLH